MGREADEAFAGQWRIWNGHTPSIAKALGVDIRNVMARRKNVEKRLGISLPASQDRTGRNHVTLPKVGCRRIATLKNATVIVFGDRHLWPGEQPTAADRALLHLIRTIEPRPKVVVMNGDLFDGASVSRHPKTDYADLPSVKDELVACQAYLAEVSEVIPDDCAKIWAVGNHDSRFTQKLAIAAPEYARIQGADLADHFQDWTFCWTVEVNKQVMICHSWHGGLHATYSNALKSGMTMVTNHLHRGQVTGVTDYTGRRWGVDTGCMTSFGPTERKFTLYTRDTPTNWGQGFAVLTFDEKGRLLPPELVQVIDDRAYWRGAVIGQKPSRSK